MTRPTQYGPGFVPNVITGGDPGLPDGQPVVDCCDDTATAPDRAADAPIFIGVTGGAGTLVHSAASNFNGSVATSLTYVPDPAASRLLVAVLVARGNDAPSDPLGWTRVEIAHGNSTPADYATMWWTGASGGTMTVTPTGVTNHRRFRVMEFDIGAVSVLDSVSLSVQSAASSYPVGPLTIASGAVLVGAVVTDEATSVTFTDDGTFTTVDQGASDGFTPTSIVSYRSVSAGTYTWTPTGDHSVVWGGILAAFSLDAGWVGGGTQVTDGDDATYETIIGPNVIRMDLGAPLEIARTRIRIATATAGSRSYVISAANAADFSDIVTIATIAFTATGSYTAQDVTDSWTPTDSYQYWQLTGDDETRRIHTWELFEPTLTTDISGVQGDIDNHIADTLDAHDASAISILDAGSYFTGTDVEAALQELGAGGGVAEPVEVVAISGAAVELDYDVARWWDITLTDDCVLTIANPPADQVAGELIVILRQGGSGSYTVTWPTEAQWDDGTGLPGGSAPTLNTDVGAQDVVTLTTVDGGITWGGSTGGGSASGAAGGDLSGTYPNPSVVDDSHNHTATTLPALGGATDHEHIVNVVFSGDASATVWELPAAPVSDSSIAVYIAGSRSIAWVLSGTLLTTLTFDSAPASASNNIVIDIVAATA